MARPKVTLVCACGQQKTLTYAGYLGQYPNRAVAYSQQKLVPRCQACGRTMEPTTAVVGSPIATIVQAAIRQERERKERLEKDRELAMILASI